MTKRFDPSSSPEGEEQNIFSSEERSYVEESHRQRMRLEKQGQQNAFSGANMPDGKPAAGRGSSGAVQHQPEGVPFTTIGKAFQDIERQLVQIIGQQVKSFADVADLAQGWRNPNYEEMRYIYVKNGVVVDHEGVTCRLPGSTSCYTGNFDDYVGHLKDRAKALDADQIYALHNHPTGDPKPSAADVEVTRYLCKVIPEIVGHVVINSGKYSIIGPDGQFETLPLENLPDGWKDPILQPSKPHEALNDQVNSAQKIAGWAKALTKDRGLPVLIYLGAGLQVRGLQEISVSALADVALMREKIPEKLLEFGSTSAALALPDHIPEELRAAVVDLVHEHHVFLDAVGNRPDGSYFSLQSGIESPAKHHDLVGGMPRTQFLAQDIREQKAAYHGLSDTIRTSGPGEAAAAGKPKQLSLFADWLAVGDTTKSPEKSRYLLAKRLSKRLDQDGEITTRSLNLEANRAFGGTMAEGAYSSKDAYDAVEVAFNIHLGKTEKTDWNNQDAHWARDKAQELTKRILKLPTQSRRDEEMEEFQQFSTPPALSFVANWAANIQPADVMMEPSAGTGDLAIWSKIAGARVVLNELSERRRDLLANLFPEATLYKENAEQLDNVLPPGVAPTVIVMNPPFSASAGRVQGQRDTAIGARHIEQALKRLQDNGRLVAIVGQGMALDRPAFKEWWKDIEEKYNVRANVGISGKEYAKYGTTFDNQILVIDKTGATTQPVLTGKVESVADLPGLLEGIKNERQQIQRSVDKPAVEKDSRNISDPVQPIDRTGEPGSDTRSAGKGTSLDERVTGAPVTDSKTLGESGIGHVVDDGIGVGRGKVRDRAIRDVGSSSGGDPGRDSGGDQSKDARTIAIETKSSQVSEFSDSVFANYTPQRLTIQGAQPHPARLVQAAAMSAVEPPAPTYSPTLPENVIRDGLLSLAQLEAIVYAGQAHSGLLPNGKRKGFFIGDGTGVGKGREISGIILDNMMQGRNKAVWISFNPGLIEDAKRDFSGVGGDPAKLFFQGKTKAGGEITQKNGILFTTYTTLTGGEKKQANDQGQKAGKTRAEQIIEWLGKDFDGVIAFDEAHGMGNAIPMKGKRGTKKPSQQAIAGINLQRELPHARILYVSATGATEISNLSYAERLGLWGEGTPFADVKGFIENVSRGGIASMELISRDMKALGMYLSRSLSYDGVSYERLEHTLSPLQEDIYNELAGAWQVVLNNVDEALKITQAGKDGQAKSAALSQFWGAHQRFFNQIITAMQTPSVIDDIRRQLDAGNAAVIQLVNTNEAAQERIIADATAKDAPLEDLDFTPRQMLLDYVRNGFPVAAYEETRDDSGNVVYVPVRDSEGNQVFDREAIALRDSLLETLQEIRVPENPLDSIINTFGPGRVAEVTGRSRRFVQSRDDEGNLKIVEEKRGKNSSRADAESFQNDKKDILIFSGAGGTGYSFHADNTAENQRKRIHYILQPGWQADKAVQGFGRTHRTNQAQEPHYVLPTTNLKAQKRFVSSIARRLDQLGALTRGQREASSQGIFTASDNLESEYSSTALKNLFGDLYRDKTGLSFNDVAKQMGLNLLDENGGLSETKIPTIPQFLNRLLSLKTDMQNDVFNEFEKRLIEAVEYSKQRGLYDVGLQTLKALSIQKTRDDVVYEDRNTGAQTRYVELAVTNNIEYRDWEDARKLSTEHRATDDLSGWFVSEFGNNKGDVFYLKDIGERLNSEGNSVRRGVIYPIRKNEHKYVDNADEISRGEAYRNVEGSYRKVTLTRSIDEAEAEKLWRKQMASAPKTITKTERMIVGVILPIWDRVEGSEVIKRLQTDDGEQLLGRMLGPKASKQTLKNLGLDSGLSNMSPSDLFHSIKNGNKAILSNGWEISTAKVNFEDRIEIKGRTSLTDAEKRVLKVQGAFIERINWEERVFIPTGESGIATFERITASKPVVDLIEKNRAKNVKEVEKEYGVPEMSTRADSGASSVKTIKSLDARKAVSMNNQKKPFHEMVAEKLIDQLKTGMAPWQRPWQPGEPGSFIPVNASTGKRYRGINTIQLISEGRSDNRWMTYRQAENAGYQVRRGEKGTRIQYWKFTEERNKLDEQGKPVLDAEGQPVKVEVKFERPRGFSATVFNTEQIDGIPPKERKPVAWDPSERAENILQASGAGISHNGSDRAFYRPGTDSIHLPEKGQFPSADRYYATALHELGHWTGHESRLARDLGHPFGSEGYAKEELRAEIASMILGDELGIGHDPGQHAAYVASWIKVLENDPLEVFRASADAEKIQDFILTMEHKQELAQEQTASQEENAVREKPMEESKAQEQAQATPETSELRRQYLAVPYGERTAAKALGAKWDKVAKSWYVGPDGTAEKLKRWLPENISGEGQTPAVPPREEFAEALLSVGAIVNGLHPIMDGKKHRIACYGDKAGEQAGFYVGHLDGHPAGYMKNNRTGLEMKWKSKGYALSPEEKAKLQAEAAEKLQARAVEEERQHELTAQRIGEEMTKLIPVSSPTTYLASKQIAVQAGIFTDSEGKKTYVPAHDAGGKVWTMQYILEDGTKRFAKNSRKEGCFHAVGGMENLFQAPAIVIAEGYSTACSLSEALGFSTVAAFDSGNLPAVAKALREKFPDKPIVIAGDNDLHLEAQGVNPGRTKAEEAAKSIRGKVMFPIFAPGEQTGDSKAFKDFNDLATKSLLGKDGIERQAKAVVSAAIEAQQAKTQRVVSEQTMSQEPTQRQERQARGGRR